MNIIDEIKAYNSISAMGYDCYNENNSSKIHVINETEEYYFDTYTEGLDYLRKEKNNK